jgi:NADH:ubiquinone oxidoreductase subunit D
MTVTVSLYGRKIWDVAELQLSTAYASDVAFLRAVKELNTVHHPKNNRIQRTMVAQVGRMVHDSEVRDVGRH